MAPDYIRMVYLRGSNHMDEKETVMFTMSLLLILLRIHVEQLLFIFNITHKSNQQWLQDLYHGTEIRCLLRGIICLPTKDSTLSDYIRMASLSLW